MPDVVRFDCDDYPIYLSEGDTPRWSYERGRVCANFRVGANASDVVIVLGREGHARRCGLFYALERLCLERRAIPLGALAVLCILLQTSEGMRDPGTVDAILHKARMIGTAAVMPR